MKFKRWLVVFSFAIMFIVWAIPNNPQNDAIQFGLTILQMLIISIIVFAPNKQEKRI